MLNGANRVQPAQGKLVELLRLDENSNVGLLDVRFVPRIVAGNVELWLCFTLGEPSEITKSIHLEEIYTKPVGAFEIASLIEAFGKQKAAKVEAEKLIVSS